MWSNMKIMHRKFKDELLIKTLNESVTNLPTPSSITYMWNFGSLLGACLFLQIFTGIFLAMHYAPHTALAFDTVIHICRDSGFGWTMRTLHANGASVFFFCLFMHVGRGIYYESFKMVKAWFVGIIILLSVMATAFLGYVLPWGQMSFWGATVITNLLSVIPFIGPDLVEWLWGSFSITNATLNRFFVFHTLVPFIIFELVILHLIYLHEAKSSNPVGQKSKYDMSIFHPFFTFKDVYGFLVFFTSIIYITCYIPYNLGDPDNWVPANSMSTPNHIKPEWYFLFAYAILRSIPNKVGGVISLVLSILILGLLPYNTKWLKKGSQVTPGKKLAFWILVFSFMILTWIGASPVEEPYVIVGQIVSIIYFMCFLKPVNFVLKKMNPKPFLNPIEEMKKTSMSSHLKILENL